MDVIKHRRNTLLLGGGVVALLAGLLVAWIMVHGHRGESIGSPPASQGGLVITAATGDSGKTDLTKPLRCFVAGQFVGELTLSECAKRNGVATDSLDVGMDATGALAAADQAGAMITPLPPPATPVAKEPQPDPSSPTSLTSTPAINGACWRYSDAQWRRLPADISLNACVQALFAGKCERPGGATYGRWAQQTLRLVPGKVEASGDNRNFHGLAEQSAACAIAQAG